MKLKVFGFLLVTQVLLLSSVFAQEANITMSKGNAFLCAVIPAHAPKYEAHTVYHYVKDEAGKRHISTDLGQRRNGLDFFKLKASQKQSMTVQLMLPDGKYFTYWYRVDNHGELLGPIPYNFVVEPLNKTEHVNQDIRFVDIKLAQDLPCSCFRDGNKPNQCARGNVKRIINNARDKAPAVGEKVGELGHRAFDSIKRGVGHVKRGWDNYKKSANENN